MDRMLVVVFDTENKAFEGKRALNQLDDEGSIAIYADALIAKNADGSVAVIQSKGYGPLGFLAGTSLGALIGLLGGPVGLVIGVTAGLVAGSLVDVNKDRIGQDFVDDVTKELVPGTFAVVAAIDEDLTTPLDVRMEGIGGKVFRRTLAEVRHTVDAEEVAVMKADLAQLKAEHAEAQADRKEKLQEKINQLDSKIQARLEKAKERHEAMEREEKAKAEVLKAKAAEMKTKAAEVHV